MTAKQYVTPAHLPPLGVAVSLALSILRVAKVRSWRDLDGQLPDEVDLSDEQLDVLAAHQLPLTFLRSTRPKTATCPGLPGVGMYLCPDCGRWGLVAAGPAPSGCTLTDGCAGRPVKIPAATPRRGPSVSTATTCPVTSSAEPPVHDEPSQVRHATPDAEDHTANPADTWPDLADLLFDNAVCNAALDQVRGNTASDVEPNATFDLKRS